MTLKAAGHEGLALPWEEYAFILSYHNSATYWIDLDQTLHEFGIHSDDLGNQQKVTEAA